MTPDDVAAVALLAASLILPLILVAADRRRK